MALSLFLFRNSEVYLLVQVLAESIHLYDLPLRLMTLGSILPGLSAAKFGRSFEAGTHQRIHRPAQSIPRLASCDLLTATTLANSLHGTHIAPSQIMAGGPRCANRKAIALKKAKCSKVKREFSRYCPTLSFVPSNQANLNRSTATNSKSLLNLHDAHSLPTACRGQSIIEKRVVTSWARHRICGCRHAIPLSAN